MAHHHLIIQLICIFLLGITLVTAIAIPVMIGRAVFVSVRWALRKRA